MWKNYEEIFFVNLCVKYKGFYDEHNFRRKVDVNL